jgi:asparagine synthase (glutamine-hydrolysing)
MSGIAGIVRFDGVPVEGAHVVEMTSAMSYRGPDGVNHWARGPVALGQCMMRTTQESLEETQPLANEDQCLVLVMDGWLSNWEELRAELQAKGARLRTRADSELVLRAYETWGADCLSHIDGDFAFVVWDGGRREVFCARDRMGHKPLYYHWNGKEFIFASEIAPILGHSSVQEVPNEGLISEYLAFQWFTRDETMWTGILRLIAAHKMRVVSAGPRIESYWSPKLDEALPYNRDEEYFEHYRELFIDCVRRASRSCNPVAYEVSGGLDSSAVFCAAAKIQREGRFLAPGLGGYTLDLSGDPYGDEIAYARSVGRHLNLTVREVAPFFPSVEWFSDHARAWRDFPGFPNAAMLMGVQREAVLQKCRVVVNGEGGDAWLTGSRLHYAQHFLEGHWKALYHCLGQDIAASGHRQAAHRLIKYGVFPTLPSAVQEGLRRARRTFFSWSEETAARVTLTVCIGYRQKCANISASAVASPSGTAILQAAQWFSAT